jgi:hypothetical protein
MRRISDMGVFVTRLFHLETSCEDAHGRAFPEEEGACFRDFCNLALLKERNHLLAYVGLPEIPRKRTCTCGNSTVFLYKENLHFTFANSIYFQLRPSSNLQNASTGLANVLVALGTLILLG